MGTWLDIRYPRLPHLVWLPADLPPHAPCHTPPSWKDKTTLVVFAVLLIGLGLCVWMPNFIVDHFAYG